MSKVYPAIYRIVNTITSDFYIGSSAYVYSRKSEHFQRLRKGIHANIHLQRAWNKYGEEAFIFEVLERPEVAILIEREQYWIDTLAPVYNIRKTAESNLGMKMGEETKEKHRQRWESLSPEAQEQHLQNLAKGWEREHGPHDPETIAIIKEKRAKQEITPAMLEALKQGQEIRKQLHPKPRLGMKNSEETRRKQSEAAKKRPPRDREVIERIAAKNRGRKQSEEEKRKRSESLKGHQVSEETRRKIVETNRLTWAEKSAEEKGAIAQKRYKSNISRN